MWTFVNRTSPRCFSPIFPASPRKRGFCSAQPEHPSLVMDVTYTTPNSFTSDPIGLFPSEAFNRSNSIVSTAASNGTSEVTVIAEGELEGGYAQYNLLARIASSDAGKRERFHPVLYSTLAPEVPVLNYPTRVLRWVFRQAEPRPTFLEGCWFIELDCRTLGRCHCS